MVAATCNLLGRSAPEQCTAVLEKKPVAQEREKITREVMRLMLFRQKSQPDVPVPRNELTKVILGNYKDSKKSNMGTLGIALAQESFCKVMGLELKELTIAPISKGKNKLTGDADTQDTLGAGRDYTLPLLRGLQYVNKC